jgi:ATP-binding cassette subfamily B protein
VPPGETVALVGPSGAGKSTVLQLLLRFYDVQRRGALDGVPVRDTAALADLRQRIGIVPQDSTVFSTSALENIRYGRPEASDAEVIAAAKAAFAHDFISPARGLRHLPGRTRRAPVGRPAPAHQHRPRDAEEPAAAAAGRGHQRARRRERAHGAGRAGAAMKDGRTTLVIAHRLATVLRADRIVVLEAGRIVDTGTPRRAGGARRAVCAAGGDAVRPAAAA